MRHLLALCLIGGTLAAPLAARSTPLGTAMIPGAASPDVTLVRDGCGPYRHRDRFGACRPNRRPPPRYLRCPPGFFATPYGCRRRY